MNDQCRLVEEQAAGFVLGALTPEEERVVREHLATCPEPHREFEELGGVLPYLAESVDVVEPPASLKGRITAAAAAEAAGQAATTPTLVASNTGTPTTAAPIAISDARARRRSPLTWVAALAAVLAIVAVGAWNVGLQRELDAARRYEAGLSAVLDVAGQPGSQTAVLTGEGSEAPSGLAAVSSDGRVTIVMRGLAPTRGSEVYEAWVIGGDGTPVPIGGFAVGDAGAATFTASGVSAGPGVTVALTREPAPGATIPTFPIISSGQAVAPST
ncbi:MAG TPA: anti-sigma factor [Candidatus Limnocylindrales bacterium]|nr:anti-sigma factor [Candidatus Limnocylindrales bacterium]